MFKPELDPFITETLKTGDEILFPAMKIIMDSRSLPILKQNKNTAKDQGLFA